MKKLETERLKERREEREAEVWDAIVKDINGANATEEQNATAPNENGGAQPSDGTSASDVLNGQLPVKSLVKQAFSLKSDTADYDVITERLDSGGRVSGMNLSILFFAILIASIGLNTNSTAVIIGAMLISPLMGTIQLMGLGIATVDAQKFKKALFGFGFQVLTALLTSTIYFWLSPLKTATSELLGRTSPTVYDILIATFGGLAGIVAVTRKDASSNVIPGVAIATALMPPLCTCGYAIANAHWAMLGGAAMLFTINTMFILVAAVTILIVLEMPESASATPELRKRMRRLLIRNASLVLVVTILLTMFVYLRNDAFGESDASPVTPENVSTVQLTNEMKVLFPEVETVQVGQIEQVGEDGKLEKQNVIYLTLNEKLSKERKNILSRWIDAAYDEEYTIVYQHADSTVVQKTEDLNGDAT